ncbi:amidohydrolase family protein [Gemmatimonas groenlandica]|uniref:Amidohydrolase family protein n=1 Tax=Gemmatimonas groenlandica TaxID=2732249 RepID=A0A6M4ISL7_9BACT|nr:amidohydrolase family protein [Gemmatimonas groenlandica]QJR36537.1 amidohydrolase family protein [Gemmatimonas groenlandica]
MATGAQSSTGATTAFTGATLIDGTDRAPIADATLVVRDGRVIAAGPAARVTIPAGAARVALAGKVIMPGIINSHGHASSAGDLATYAAYGVTTLYSLGGEPADVFAARDAQREAQRSGAPLSPLVSRVFLAGPVMTPTTPDEARTQVAGVAAQHVDIAKIRVDDNLGLGPKMTPEVYRAVINEAHARKLRLAVHMYYFADAVDLLNSGADFMAHSVRDVEVNDAFAASLRAKKVCYTPTLMREVSTFVYESTPSFFADSLFLAHANKVWMATLQQPARMEAMRTSASAQQYKKQLPVAMRNLKRLSDAGVRIAMGTDTGPMGRFQGYFELMELEMMVEAGMTPRAVLAAATRDAASCMKIDRELGTLEPGKWADFLVLNANPLENISNVRKQHSVWIGGKRVGTGS